MVHTLALALFLDSLFPVDIRGPEEGGGWMVMCAPVPLRARPGERGWNVDQLSRQRVTQLPVLRAPFK